MTQEQWRKWGAQRASDADVIARTYRKQGQQAMKLAEDAGCPCNPIIVVGTGPDGPIFSNPHVTHALDCRHD